MTPEETKQAAAVMIAHAEGKKIECKNRYGNDTWDKIISPVWNWEACLYRIVPEPLEVDVWVHEDGSVVSNGEHTKSYASYGWTLRRATIHPETK